jgi:hypothetical protein
VAGIRARRSGLVTSALCYVKLVAGIGARRSGSAASALCYVKLVTGTEARRSALVASALLLYKTGGRNRGTEKCPCGLGSFVV